MASLSETFKVVKHKLIALAVLMSWSIWLSAQEDAASIIKKSAEANDRDWAAAPQFDNSERDVDKNGDRTYDVIILFGSPYQRLIAINGRELTPAEQSNEQKKYNNAVKERQHESSAKRSQRIAKYEAERKRDYTLIQQMVLAFDFSLVGEDTLMDHQVYVLKATPRAGYRPPNRDSTVLTGMEGTLWIDRDTYQWVKVQARVVHPVRIEGFLAEVEPGTQFLLEKEPVSEGIWLAKHFSMKSNARVLLLFPHHGQEDDSFFNYHKAAKDSPGSEPSQ
jgi:hypothetical protein